MRRQKSEKSSNTDLLSAAAWTQMLLSNSLPCCPIDPLPPRSTQPPALPADGGQEPDVAAPPSMQQHRETFRKGDTTFWRVLMRFISGGADRYENRYSGVQ